MKAYPRGNSIVFYGSKPIFNGYWLKIPIDHILIARKFKRKNSSKKGFDPKTFGVIV